MQGNSTNNTETQQVLLPDGCLQEIKTLSTMVRAMYDVVIAKEDAVSQWVTVEIAATLLNKSEWTVRDLIRKGRLEARMKDGKSQEINKQSILNYKQRL